MNLVSKLVNFSNKSSVYVTTLHITQQAVKVRCSRKQTDAVEFMAHGCVAWTLVAQCSTCRRLSRMRLSVRQVTPANSKGRP